MEVVQCIRSMQVMQFIHQHSYRIFRNSLSIVHWLQNGGRCGVCGDPWHMPHLHETGGVYANGLLGRQYSPGQVIEINIELSANHQGYFELSLCPLTDNAEKESQGCFDK